MEKLYNNIELPEKWPPEYGAEELYNVPPVPYLENPPEVIDISVGRQLFVDDFLIEETDMDFQCHSAVKFEGNPIFKPETSWEKDETIPVAAPKSGGVWYDKDDGIFKMWYEAGWLNRMAYAESCDGINWVRPRLDVVEGTNIILDYEKRGLAVCDEDIYIPEFLRPDSNAVFIDYDGDRSQKYKMLFRNPGGEAPAKLLTSTDGINWENLTMTSDTKDRTTMFYNPFRRKWVYSLRELAEVKGKWVRVRAYSESDDFLSGADWKNSNVLWMSGDKNNQTNPYTNYESQLYNVDAAAYESIMLGMFQVMRGPENESCEKSGAPKITELIPMYSRDGFHFTRPTDKPIVCAEMHDGAWDRGYVQSVGGVYCIVGDEVWIYYIGFAGDENRQNVSWEMNGMYANASLGIAKIRRDGFVSVNSEKGGRLLTRPLSFKNKKYMFVNFEGSLSAELLSPEGEVLAKSHELRGDSTCKMLDFADFDISALCDKPFRICFKVTGKLYSFWFSNTNTGESDGKYSSILK